MEPPTRHASGDWGDLGEEGAVVLAEIGHRQQDPVARGGLRRGRGRGLGRGRSFGASALGSGWPIAEGEGKGRQLLGVEAGLELLPGLSPEISSAPIELQQAAAYSCDLEHQNQKTCGERERARSRRCCSRRITDRWTGP